MGVEFELYVDGATISKQFVCPICQGVVDPPVTTPCDHLFCEECLMQWLQRKEQGAENCPMCNQWLDVDKIRQPNRIILNLLGELERYCAHREEGCTWKGPQETYAAHHKRCEFIPRKELISKIERRDARISDLVQVVRSQEAALVQSRERLEMVNLENNALREQLQALVLPSPLPFSLPPTTPW